jgi:hypothetical protein
MYATNTITTIFRKNENNPSVRTVRVIVNCRMRGLRIAFKRPIKVTAKNASNSLEITSPGNQRPNRYKVIVSTIQTIII